MRLAGAIIAGGRSSRMGTDKAMETIGSSTILDRIIACLARQSEIVILNSNAESLNFPERRLTVVPDVLREISTPLAGLHASLAWGAAQGYEWIMTVPADTPFLPSDLARRLLAAAHESGAAITASAGHRHFIIGAWSSQLAGKLETAIVRDGLHRVRDWTERAGAAEAEWAVTDYDPFFNVNTPEDLSEARRLAAKFSL